MMLLRRYIRRYLNRINLKLIILITFPLTIGMITWKTIQHAWNMNKSVEISYQAFGREKILYKGKQSESKQYLSYQPPGGGWNNQRIAFENAVIMAALLKRTLLIQPIAPHDRILELKTQYNQSAGYTIYNMLTTRELVPISKLIDLDKLSSFLSVLEITLSHNDFIKKYNASSWYKVCRNGLTHAWVDKIPTGYKGNLNFYRYSKNFKKGQPIARYRHVCPEKTESENERGFWEFLPELRKRKEDIIYFKKGSLFARHVFFTDYRRALSAQKALTDWIKPAPEVQYNVARIVVAIGKPFNAIHVRRSDHKTGQILSVRHWLFQLTKENALLYSNKLYIATDETNLTWFSPLKEAGYRISFAKDFKIFRKIYESNTMTGKDIIGFHEQVICSHAKIFIGSHYSTFSRIIERYRKTQLWDKKHFKNFVFSSVKWINIYQQHARASKQDSNKSNIF